MKIYLWDNGWRGATFYIANSREDATAYFRKEYPNEFDRFQGEKSVGEYEIVLGLSIETQGD